MKDPHALIVWSEHPETPTHGAPKPFTDERWPAVQRRLRSLATQVGLPIDPPRRNVNSRLALESAEELGAAATESAA